MTVKLDQIKSMLTLELDSNTIKPADFIEILQSFDELVNIIYDSVLGEEKLDWHVSVDKGSALIQYDLPTDNIIPFPKKARGLFLINKGLESLDRDEDLPEGFPLEALKPIEQISKNKDFAVRIWTEKENVLLSEAIMKNATARHVSDSYQALGTVEGTIETIQARKNACIIYEPILDKPIRCFGTDAFVDFVDEANKSLKKRVEIRGEITYDRLGFPTSVKAYKLEVLPTLDDVPHFKKMLGILKYNE
jgi:hypothetical protein